MLAVTVITGKGTVQARERTAEVNWCSTKTSELDMDSNLCSGTDQLYGLRQVP